MHVFVQLQFWLITLHVEVVETREAWVTAVIIESMPINFRSGM